MSDEANPVESGPEEGEAEATTPVGVDSILQLLAQTNAAAAAAPGPVQQQQQQPPSLPIMPMMGGPPAQLPPAGSNDGYPSMPSLNMANQFYDPAAAYPSAPPSLSHSGMSSHGVGPGGPSIGGQADEYAFNPRHKVHFTSPPSVMFALPPNSRLFVGNLASEKTSKEELARIFAQYGDILEVSTKESYGFIQYDNAESVLDAIRQENGRVVAGLKMDLSVAKNRRERNAEAAAKARDPAPFAGGGGRFGGPPGGGGYPPRGRDRDRPYDRERERTSGRNRGDDYSPDRDRDRNRGRSWSPGRNRGGGGGGGGGGRHDESPLSSILGGRLRLDVTVSTSDFPLPRRYGTNVPEVQIIAITGADKQYVFHVENKFRQAGLKVEVVFLAPRMSLESVLLQMNHEGVKAVVFVERASANNESVTMLIFDGNTGYVEYDRVNLDKAVNDVRMAKAQIAAAGMPNPMAQMGGMVPPPGYGGPPMGMPPQQSQSAPAGTPNLDFNALNSLLGAIQGVPQGARPPAPYGAPMPGQQAYGAPQQQGAPADMNSLLSMLGGVGGQKPPQGAPGAYPSPQGVPGAYPSAPGGYPSMPPQQQSYGYPSQPMQIPPQQGAPAYGQQPPPAQRGGYQGGRGGYRGR